MGKSRGVVVIMNEEVKRGGERKEVENRRSGHQAKDSLPGERCLCSV